MIPKISSGSNYFGLLSYLEKKDNKHSLSESGIEVILGSQRIFVDNFDIDTNISLFCDKKLINADFLEWDKMSKNKNFENKVAHISLSFAHHDTIDREKIVVISKEFLESMGYKNNPVAIYQHNDKHHNHVHIVTSRVGEDGKKINDSNEAKRAIAFCRDLEIKYHLTQVLKSESVQSNLEQVSSKTINASADTPFRNAIIQNLQYYLHQERVGDMALLQQKLLNHKIEMVLHDKDGNKLPKNGVRFYHKNGNKVISYLSGRHIEKKFVANLEMKLQANATKSYEVVKAVKTDEKVHIPTLKPYFAIQKAIGGILYESLQRCVDSVIVTQHDLTALLAVHKIIPEFKMDKEGNLTGLSFIYDNVRYKGSDFTVKGIKLSASLLAPHISEFTSGSKITRFAIEVTQAYIQATGGVLLTKQEIIEVLNRNNIKLVEGLEGKASLVINQLGKNYAIDLNKYSNGYEGFLQAAGFNGTTELPKDLQLKIAKPVSLVTALNLQERAVYTALLKGGVKDIQEISKLQINLRLSLTENSKLLKPIGLLKHYNGMHHLMSRASNYLKYLKKSTAVTPGIQETIKSLNLRGIAVLPVFETIEKEGVTINQLKKVDFKPIGDSTGNPPLNFFQTITAFGPEALKELFDNPHPKDELFLNQPLLEPGVYFEFSPEVTELIIAAESEPSLIHENKEDLLEEYPELENEVEYIESLEEHEYNKGLYTYPDRNTLSTLFKDHGRLVNRGADGSGFKNLKTKGKHKRLKG